MHQLDFHLEHYTISILSEKMPEYMNNVLTAIGNKRISCSYSLDILLDCIGDLVQNHTTFRLTKMFDSEEAFAEYCVEVVISHYIKCAINNNNTLNALLCPWVGSVQFLGYVGVAGCPL
jgi:hypothetical protein